MCFAIPDMQEAPDYWFSPSTKDVTPQKDDSYNTFPVGLLEDKPSDT